MASTSTISSEQLRSDAPSTLVLENGASMTAAEFHDLYAAYPDDTRFELVEGVVYMASPLHEPHGDSSMSFNVVAGYYRSMTPGLAAGESVSTRLDALNEVQPDSHIRIDESRGGQSKVLVSESGKRTIIQGAPEFVAEVANSSRSIDFGRKLDAYLRAGVKEYLVLNIADRELRWFSLPARVELIPDDDGVIRSKVLPGLWVLPEALLSGDAVACVELLKLARESDEHRAFCAQLAAAKK